MTRKPIPHIETLGLPPEQLKQAADINFKNIFTHGSPFEIAVAAGTYGTVVLFFIFMGLVMLGVIR